MPVRTGVGGDAQVVSVGTAAPEFSLADLSGEMRTLGSLRAAGRPVLLVFVDPGCGPCAALIPKVAQWQRRHQDELTTVLVDRRGEGVEHRAKRIEQGLGVVLVQRDREVAAAYGVEGTPAAVLVATNGIIASPIATGADAIDALVARTLAHLAVAHPTTANGRGGAPAPVPRQSVSAPAPPFSLPDLDGRTVRLADLEGHDTVLVFWNPACGYCQAMLDALRVAVSGNDVVASVVVLISSGGAEANRRLGLPCPILLDDAFATGRAFGARGTPSAVVVDAQGRIGSRLVVGEGGVLQSVRGRRLQIRAAEAH
jgi:peroxiredoxin